MTFIRAPYIEDVVSDRCLPSATVDGHIVAARQGRQIATAFHPELDEDTRLHEFFLGLSR
jgi:5'-phosphate synthase pdxT subunit